MLYEIFSTLVDDLSWETIIEKIGTIPFGTTGTTSKGPSKGQQQMEFLVE
jgi:hypothetical protein